jgi:hypothetical protein
VSHSPEWLKQFIRWLRKLLGPSSARNPIKIVEQYHNGNVSVLRLHDPTIPGAVDLWRIDRHHERTKFFVCIINVAKLREDLAVLGDRAVGSPSRRGLAHGLWQQIADQSDILATHYWITGWDKEFTGTDCQGRRYHSHRVSELNLLACDLQGAAGAFAGDRYATRYARDIIKRLAANEFRELAHHRSWDAAIKAIDWPQWLEGLSRSRSGGISESHSLRPKRAKRAR